MRAVFFFVFYIFIISMIVACGKADEPDMPLPSEPVQPSPVICKLETEDTFNENPLDCVIGTDEQYEKERKEHKEKKEREEKEEHEHHSKD